MRLYKKQLNKPEMMARLGRLRKASPNSEVGVVVVKELSSRVLSEKYKVHPQAQLKNRKVHRRFVTNLLTAVPSKLPLERKE